MSDQFGILVTDASPLITLAAADALDLLTVPQVPVFVPDMVYWEVTRDLARLGATTIVEWTRRSRGLVTIEPTVVFAEFQALRYLDPKTSSRGRGERAAAELLGVAAARDDKLITLLLFEDSDVMKRKIEEFLPERATRMSTGVYLRELEAAGRIQSADEILDRAMARGRNVAQQRVATSAEIAGRLAEQIRKAESSRRGPTLT